MTSYLADIAKNGYRVSAVGLTPSFVLISGFQEHVSSTTIPAVCLLEHCYPRYLTVIFTVTTFLARGPSRQLQGLGATPISIYWPRIWPQTVATSGARRVGGRSPCILHCAPAASCRRYQRPL